MQLIAHLLEHLHGDHISGLGGNSLERINRPVKPCGITPNRTEVFKRFNYRFQL